MNINWYPGHMTKARRELEKKVKLIDVVIEVLDARAPMLSLNPDFQDLFTDKKKLYILNKADMADPAATKKWVDYFESCGIPAAAYSVLTGNPRDLQKKIESAAQEIYDKYSKKGINKTVRALVCGIPNVGKSAILNRLYGKKKLAEGNRPGVTRGLSWVKLTPYLELMDSPGLLWPKIEDELTGATIALIGCIKTEILDEEELAFYLIKLLMQSAPKMLAERYKLENLEEEPWDVMAQICKKRGFLLRGGEVDSERGAKMLISEFANSKLGRITLELPPSTVEV